MPHKLDTRILKVTSYLDVISESTLGTRENRTAVSCKQTNRLHQIKTPGYGGAGETNQPKEVNQIENRSEKNEKETIEVAAIWMISD